jgi:small subunit ribosomal protein S3
MGQKVHPYGFRLGINKPWKSRWFVERGYDKLLVEDVKLKAELREKLKAAGVSSVEVERPGNKLRLIIRTARPGIIIGRKGAEIDKLKADIQKRTSREVFIDILEVNKPELDAQLVAENIALQLEKRVSFRRAMRKSVDSAKRFGCKGIKVRVSGRHAAAGRKRASKGPQRAEIRYSDRIAADLVLALRRKISGRERRALTEEILLHLSH